VVVVWFSILKGVLASAAANPALAERRNLIVFAPAQAD
jgi:hypothetical protein